MEIREYNWKRAEKININEWDNDEIGYWKTAR